jgi:uncharacterized protein
MTARHLATRPGPVTEVARAGPAPAVPRPRGREGAALVPEAAPAEGLDSVVDFIGRGLAWPLQVDHRGAIRLTGGIADIDASIRLVLITAPGERVMRPEFGCRIHDLVFEPLNANTLGLITAAVRDALTRWEPRVLVEDVTALPDAEASGRVLITIGYRVRATNDRRNLVHPFYVIPQDGS